MCLEGGVLKVVLPGREAGFAWAPGVGNYTDQL